MIRTYQTKLKGMLALTTSYHTEKSLQKEKSLYKFIWVRKGSITLEIDHQEVILAENEVISLRTVSRLKSHPTGYCIHELATRIHHAERLAPKAVSHVAVRWKPRLTLRQPKNITAMKVDSRKNARMPSMASGAPKMSPTKWE